jgi:F0F1-type ATP synthase epsilon subunit
MKFILLSPEISFTTSNCEKVRANLTTGVVEILNQHQVLIGRITNQLVEYEAVSQTENKSEKRYFAIKNAIFIVNTPESDSNTQDSNLETSITIAAERGLEITSSFSADFYVKEYEVKTIELENELQRLKDIKLKEDSNFIVNNENLFSQKSIRLSSDLEFLKTLPALAKGVKF